ncbi:MAG: CatB-related O-acetyltransferase [Planctomycetota bacterium]|jgi:acetyltransferase-like isoleucine patch superfamily enzyme
MRIFCKKKKDIIDIPRGKHTYGPDPELMGRPKVVNELAEGSSIGSFCSIARGLQFLFRGKHNVNWVSTYPFYARKGWRPDDKPGDLPIPPDPIVIGNDVWIATNVKIMQGVTVGDGAVIAQESFVTKDVPPYAMIGGHPAKIICYRFAEEQISELLKIAWWNWDDEVIRKMIPLLISDNIDEFIEQARDF